MSGHQGEEAADGQALARGFVEELADDLVQPTVVGLGQDHGPARAAQIDQPLGVQGPVGAQDGVLVHAAFAGEVARGRQRAPGWMGPGGHGVAQVRGERLVQRTACLAPLNRRHDLDTINIISVTSSGDANRKTGDTMDTETIAIICAVLAALLTPIYILLFVRGVRSLEDMRDVMRRPIQRS